MLKHCHLKLILFSCFVLFLMPVAHAQNEQDLKKMMDEAKKMINSDKDMDPDVKKQMLQFLNSEKTQKGIPVAQKEYHPAIELTTLPKCDDRRLAAIPAKIMSDQEAAQYIQHLSDKIEKQLGAADLNDAKKILVKSGNDVGISNEGIVSWYEGKPNLALSLTAKSAVNGKNLTGINNLAAMLNILGYEEKAIPMLQYALHKNDSSSLLLNNLGRAYLGLGDKQKAKQYYLQCIAVAPSHPEANNALGCLYEEAGDPVKATEHFEKSIEGGFNEEAYRHLKKLKPQAPIVILVKKHHKAPEYFNQFRFQVPGECYTYMDYYRVKEAHESFQRSISALSKEYSALQTLHEEKSNREIEKFQKDVFSSLAKGEMVQGTIRVYPFAAVAGLAINELQMQGAEILAQFRKDYERNMADLKRQKDDKAAMIEKEYKAQYKMGDMGECTNCCLNCDEVNRAKCKALEASALSFQADAAAFHKEFVDKSRLQLTGYFDDMIYWFALLGPSEESFDVNFYNTINHFLSAIEDLSKSTPMLVGPKMCGGEEAPKVAVIDNKYDVLNIPNCPVNISIPVVVGKISLNCTSFSISGGEGVKGSYSKNFITGQTTLTIGMGVTYEAGSAGIASVSAGADGSFYMTFDKSGGFSDAGMKFSVGASAGVGAVNSSTSAGVTMGMNSGFNYTGNAPDVTITL